jgi:hypothetical protein
MTVRLLVISISSSWFYIYSRSTAEISPEVTIPGTGRLIYKSHLVSMLNNSPELSKDR